VEIPRLSLDNLYDLCNIYFEILSMRTPLQHRCLSIIRIPLILLCKVDLFGAKTAHNFLQSDCNFHMGLFPFGLRIREVRLYHNI
jgi:hypothetical protein